MPETTVKTDLCSLTVRELESYFSSLGEPKYRAKQFFSAIARGMVGRFRSAGYQIGPQGLHRKARVSGIFAKVGNIVSIVGLIVSIVMFIVSLCLFIAFLVAAVSKKH